MKHFISARARLCASGTALLLLTHGASAQGTVITYAVEIDEASTVDTKLDDWTAKASTVFPVDFAVELLGSPAEPFMEGNVACQIKITYDAGKYELLEGIKIVDNESVASYVDGSGKATGVYKELYLEVGMTPGDGQEFELAWPCICCIVNCNPPPPPPSGGTYTFTKGTG